MQVQKVDVFVSSVSMVEVWQRSYAGKKRARMGSERVEAQAVDAKRQHRDDGENCESSL